MCERGARLTAGVKLWVTAESLTVCRARPPDVVGLRLVVDLVAGHLVSHVFAFPVEEMTQNLKIIVLSCVFCLQGTGRLPTSESSPATGYLSCVQKPEAVVHAMKVP